MAEANGSIHLVVALQSLERGFSPVPPADDGSKRPLADIQVNGKWTWEPYQTAPATPEHVKQWYRAGRTGNGLACGYGGLECLEFDNRDTYDAFLEVASEAALDILIDKIRTGYEEFTPGGGVHWLYRCSEPRGNTKLAERPIENQPHGRKVLIETRGAGGFVIIAPSCGKVHPTGEAYRLTCGGISSIHELTPAERDTLWNLARTFDEMPIPAPTLPSKGSGFDQRPGDLYEAEMTWLDILGPLGWRKLFDRGDVSYWTRPGKDAGVSATTGYCKGLFVFSTSTSFEPRKSYSKFAAYAHLQHGGDFARAAKALALVYAEQLAPARHARSIAEQAKQKPVLPRLTIGLDQIQLKKIDWLYENRIAPGFITLFAGRSGLGKSFVTCDIAARWSRGEPAYRSDIMVLDPIRTLFISEDSPEAVLGPRLVELGVVRQMVRFMTWDAMAAYSLADTEFLTRAYDECGNPGLVVIDPPANFIGRADSHKDSEVRGVLKALVAWLDAHRVAAILITHINKQIGKGMDAVDRIMGSVAWGSVARITCAFAKDPDIKGQVLFGGTKNNLGPIAEPLAFRIDKTETLASVVWTGTSDTSMDDAIDKVKRKSRGLCATEWLEERFREKPEWPSDELKQMAKEAGHSNNALWSPEVNALPIRKIKRTMANGESFWVWKANDGWPQTKCGGIEGRDGGNNDAPY